MSAGGMSDLPDIDNTRLPRCDICSRGLVDFACEGIESQWHTIQDAGCELTLCHDCWSEEVGATCRA